MATQEEFRNRFYQVRGMTPILPLGAEHARLYSDHLSALARQQNYGDTTGDPAIDILARAEDVSLETEYFLRELLATELVTVGQPVMSGEILVVGDLFSTKPPTITETYRLWRNGHGCHIDSTTPFWRTVGRPPTSGTSPLATVRVTNGDWTSAHPTFKEGYADDFEVIGVADVKAFTIDPFRRYAIRLGAGERKWREMHMGYYAIQAAILRHPHATEFQRFYDEALGLIEQAEAAQKEKATPPA